MYRSLIVLGTLLMIGCAGRASVSSTSAPAPRAGVPVYDGSVAIDPTTQHLRAQWRIAFLRDARTTDSVTFLLNDALIVSRVAGGDVRSYAERSADGLKRLTVRLAPRLAGDATEVQIEYAGVPKLSSDSINSIRSDWVELGLDSFWHPVFDDFAQAIVARVRLQIPEGWTVSASGSTVRENGAYVLTNDIPLIDIAFSASPAFQHAEAGRVTVYHVGGEPKLVSKVLETSTSCAQYLDAHYGASTPLPPVKMVIAPRGGPGYARKNYVMITRVADTASVRLQSFICHELAHFWSSRANSSGPENWLNEAFAEYVAARYVRSVVGDSAYGTILANWKDVGQGQPPIWTPALTRRPNARVAYRKAPYLLHRLEERIGSAPMDRILSRYMTESVRTTPALLDIVGDVAGADARSWFTTELAT